MTRTAIFFSVVSHRGETASQDAGAKRYGPAEAPSQSRGHVREAASSLSRSVKLPIGQAFNAVVREKAVAVEQLVDLPSTVALLAPEWPQYRPLADSNDGGGEILWARGIEGDGRNVTTGDGTGQPCDIDHVDDLDLRSEDALKLDDA